MLNMRSAVPVPGAADLTARARIRDAAIARFAAAGVAATGVRAVARDAGVSAGLVMHHFGSKEGLQAACDAHVCAVLRQQKSAAMAAGASLDPVAALRQAAEGPPLTRYLARRLVEGSGEVGALFDELVADAVGYMAQGVDSGLLRPSADPVGRAAVLTAWSLGALVLHEHLQRVLGVDLLGAPGEALAYLRPALDLLSGGLLTPEHAARLTAALDDAGTGGVGHEARNGPTEKEQAS